MAKHAGQSTRPAENVSLPRLRLYQIFEGFCSHARLLRPHRVAFCVPSRSFFLPSPVFWADVAIRESDCGGRRRLCHLRGFVMSWLALTRVWMCFALRVTEEKRVVSGWV